MVIQYIKKSLQKRIPGKRKNNSIGKNLDERIIAELVFYDGKSEAEQFLLSNKYKLYRPCHVAHSLYPFLDHHGLGTLVTDEKERVKYIVKHSTRFMRNGTRIANPFLYGGKKK